MDILHRRDDGSFVVSLNGLPFHVQREDALWAEVAAEAAGVALPPEVPPQPAAAPAMIAKTVIYRRMSDAEVAAVDAFLTTQATLRQRLMWRDAEGGLVLLADVRPVAEALFGEERAAVLLAPA